jgi:thiopeptide-type bacteriocin biosynthesis protein
MANTPAEPDDPLLSVQQKGRDEMGRAFYRAQPGILVRSVHHGGLPIPPAPAMFDFTSRTPTPWLPWVRETWSIPQIADAVRHASPDLAREIDDLRELPLRAESSERLGLALLSYVLRLRHRATPFGLFAGVAEGRFGRTAVARWGQSHHAVSRADGAWITAIVQHLEAIPEVRMRLRLTANNGLRVRGERLVLPWQPRSLDAVGTAVREVSIRQTAAVRTAVQMASAPVPYREVVHKLIADHPDLAAGAAEALLDLMISRHMLLTSLQPAGTETDALGYVVRELFSSGAAQVGQAADLACALREIDEEVRALNRQHSASPDGGRRRTALVTRMRQLAAQPSPLTVDVRLNADVVVPRSVAWEAERAVGVLARVSPEPRGTLAWIRYRERFRQTYGDGTLVPFQDLLDELGLPEDFHGTRRAPQPATVHRDKVLVALAQQAVTDGRELLVDEALVQRLAGGVPPHAEDAPAHVELAAVVHAASAQDLEAGDFALEVRRVGRGWGHLSGGRFAALLAEQGSPSDLLGTLARRPTAVKGALPVQLSFPPLSPPATPLTLTPRLTAPLISLSEYRSAHADVIPLTDLGVMHHHGRLHLVSRSRGQVLEAAIPHPLQLECQTPAIARFLDELQRGQSSRVIGSFGNLAAWDWGAARHLAIRPRVRAGRSILSPATWRLAHAGLPGKAASATQWEDAFAALRERWQLPGGVYLEHFDTRLRLDLDTASHRALLRAQLERARPLGELTLVEAEPESVYGWCGGRPHEIVILLGSTAAPRPAPTVHDAPIAPRADVHLPGSSRYLSVRLYCQPQVRSAVLADHLPVLLDDLDHPAWWFTPHDQDDRPHSVLNLRLDHPVGAAGALGFLGPWVSHLTDTGVLSGFDIVPYRPHTGLWGENETLMAAEDVLAADSASIAHQVAHVRAFSPHALAAANLVAIAAGFHQDTERGLQWLANQPKPGAAPPLPRDLVQQTRALAGADGWHVLRGAPGGTALVEDRWAPRHAALGDYRTAVDRTPHTDPNVVLEALLTAHLRLVGQSPGGTAWRLARSVALAATAPRR